MKRLTMFVVLVLAVSCAFGQERTVRPIPGSRGRGLASGGLIGVALAHGERYAYASSTGLSIKDTKANYTKKDLEKLEAQGVKITVYEIESTPSTPLLPKTQSKCRSGIFDGVQSSTESRDNARRKE